MAAEIVHPCRYLLNRAEQLVASTFDACENRTHDQFPIVPGELSILTEPEVMA